MQYNSKEWKNLNHTNERVMEENRRWGWYKVLENIGYTENRRGLVKHLCIKEGENISYQKHQKRDEIWVIAYGMGVLILNDELKRVRRGSVVYIKSGDKHLILAEREIHLIEIQLGEELIEEDIERIESENSKIENLININKIKNKENKTSEKF